MQKNDHIYFEIVIPKGKINKQMARLYRQKRSQLEKAISKLRNNPQYLQDRNIEKLQDSNKGQYTIRVSKKDRLFYNVDSKKRLVIIVMAGPHDYYRLT